MSDPETHDIVGRLDELAGGCAYDDDIVSEISRDAADLIRHLEAQVKELEAQATTYWDCLTDILPIAERGLNDGSLFVLKSDQDAMKKARSAVARPRVGGSS